MRNTFGELFTLTTFGESHGEAIGGVVDGMPAGIDIDLDFIQAELDRRRPGQSQLTTSRQEAARVEKGKVFTEGRYALLIICDNPDAVKEAHIEGGVPNIVLEVEERSEEGFAALVCFFELACAISGYMSRVKPFDQPGVEAYKKNMFRMLGKPGAK